MIQHNVPFFANPDDTHCFQACLKMIFAYFEPEKEFSFDYLDQLSGKKPDLWTWPTKMYLELINLGYDIILMDIFDYSKFVLNPFDYLVQEYDLLTATEQKENSDLDYEVSIAKNFLANYDYHLQSPTVKDIKDLLTKGYLLGCNINSRLLNGKEGYAGHFVIVSGFDQSGWIIQDPGGLQVGFANRRVEYDLFQKCWAYPNDRACNLLAIKK